ncbi:MAG: hypothetical protein OXG23_04605 [Chloroflexi bacterium]|nr:hypothetical protein [Chloroflexota bacterium]MCY3977359.1 hypothetical protein [Chloroflexota bacterium]
MRLMAMVVLVAGMIMAGVTTLADGHGMPLHASYGNGHCNVRHGGSIVYVGYTFHTATGKVVASSWDRRKLAPDETATKAHDDDVITVKIRVRTPYHTYVTVASKSCSGGH